ncbi:MAG: carboxypeptidase regulatory-like domain-containing protein, partial [Synergistaceae bacterium]
MENKVIDNKTRRYCLYIGLLACLVAVTAMAGHAAAAGWYLADRDGTQAGDLDGTNGMGTLSSYSDIKYYKTNIGGLYYNQQLATTEWVAVGSISTGRYMEFRIRDSAGSELISSPYTLNCGYGDGLEIPVFYRVERVYEGGYKVKSYKNGVYNSVKSIPGTTPYYVTWSGSSITEAYIYFLSYGDAERKLVNLPPSSYFIAKDFTNPALSGLYSAPGVAKSATTFHAVYCSDVPGTNITITNKDTETVVYSHATTGYTGIYAFDLDDIFFDSGADYGIYEVAMNGSTQSQDIEYRGITSSGTSVEWDESEYVEYDDATITYSISEEYWLTDDYTYKLTVEDADFDEMTYWSIITRPTSAEKELTIYSSVFPESGYYYTCLYAIDKSSGEEILMCYDYAYVYMPGSGEVIVEGETHDATTGNLLGSCVVTATQGGTPTSDTSDATDATYQILGLVTDSSIGVNATKTDYIGYPIYFTPYEGGHYEVDVPLVPSGGASPGEWQEVTGGQLTQISHNNVTTTYYNLTEDGTAIGGLVYEAPYWNLCDGATVTLSNATWNTNTTTGDGGWYQIDNISAGGNYNFCCEKDGYQTVNETITVTAASFNRQDCYLNGDFTLTINIKNLDTSTTITDEVSVSLDSGETTTTSTGTCTFEDLDYGYYTITGECVGYYAGTAYAVVDGDVTENLYLQAESEGGSGFGVGYAPKTVRFTTQTIWGSPIQDCC